MPQWQVVLLSSQSGDSAECVDRIPSLQGDVLPLPPASSNSGN